MAFMINKLAIINSCEIIHEIFFAKIYCEIQVCTILVRTLYSIKYGILSLKCLLFDHYRFLLWRVYIYPRFFILLMVFPF
jgi:hypothetical protein